jgi:hypothetical protein
MEFEAWKRIEGKYFGKIDPECERARPPAADAPYELVETSYYGFHIPEAGLNGEIYHWAHPVFGTSSGGIWIYGRGAAKNIVETEFFDYRNFMPMPKDISDCTYPTGISVKVQKPLEEIDIAYDDAASGTSLKLNLRAIMPPAFRPAGGHITQALKSSGSLVLHGQQHKIDGYFTRDRSWGDARSETNKDIPPFGWYVVAFNDNLAFHISAFESPESNAAFAARYPGLANGKNFVWGYVWKDGELLGVKACLNLVKRDAAGVAPVSMRLDIVDEHDTHYEMTVQVQGYSTMNVWASLYAHWCSAIYEYNGMTAWGEYQEGIGPHCAKRMLKGVD